MLGPLPVLIKILSCVSRINLLEYVLLLTSPDLYLVVSLLLGRGSLLSCPSSVRGFTKSALCGGKSHQLESCPNLSVSKKIEVLVEQFDV